MRLALATVAIVVGVAQPAAAWATVCSTSTAPTLVCDGSSTDDTLLATGPNDLQAYGSCSGPLQRGPDRIFPFVCPDDVTVDIVLADTDCDLDLYVMGASCIGASDCVSNDTRVSAGVGIQGLVTFDCVAGQTYYVVVEGWDLEAAPTRCRRQAGVFVSDFTVSALCEEVCGDGLDNDGDGQTDCADGDCTCPEDCATPGDEDRDGRADCADDDCRNTLFCCDLDGDGYDAMGLCGGDDCDDDDRRAYPGAPETVADGRDQDCDGVDTCWRDVDGDGFGVNVRVVGDDLICGNAPGEAAVRGDCYDDGPGAETAYPFAPEVAGDGLDQDCDGVDACHRDLDRDGFGVSPPEPAPTSGCSTPGWSAVGGDCLDVGPGAAQANPAGVEVCDGVDNDCDGLTDADDPDTPLFTTLYADADGDGYGTGTGTATAGTCDVPDGFGPFDGDCDDADPDRSPGTTEVPYDGLDQDCSGADLVDVDGDGSVGPRGTGPDCDDQNPLVNPARGETPNGIDDDCDGDIDEATDWSDDDGDGFAEAGGDCDDAEALVSPAGVETCDGLDNDCDGTVDDGLPCFDDDGDGLSEDDGDCNDRDASINPSAVERIGNGLDDDCDGLTDQIAFDRDGDGVTDLAGDCDDTDPMVHPFLDERPNQADDDCDGIVDETTELYDDDGDGFSEVLGDCHDHDVTVFPGAEETWNGIDDDCDGEVDDVGPNGDLDRDGYTPFEGDCDDQDAGINPGAVERADGVDQDCDGLIDEWVDDADRDGFTAADGDCDDAEGWAFPGADEVCDRIDNDCDGDIDEGCTLGGRVGDDPNAGLRSCDHGGQPPASALLLLLGLLGWRRGSSGDLG